MIHEEGSFKRVKDFGIYHQVWRPEGDPRAALLLVHGYAEHSGRYIHVADYFVGQGYAVYALDHRGHGKSAGRRGYFERFQFLVDDLDTFFDLVRQREPGRTIFLVGHSMGGLLAAAYTIQHPDKVDGLVLSGPWFRPSEGVSPLLQALSEIIAALFPGMGVTRLAAAAISRDPEIVARYDSDPLNYRGQVPACVGVEMLKTAQWVLRDAHTITCPVLIMHGIEDKLADPAASRELYESISSQDKTLKLWDGLYHEIFNEPEKDQVLAFMRDWLAQRTSRRF
ncbi:MAG: lysophospholipase [Anaerolineae bacterium]|jgi:alpha-beta hydrolase superfamily lysophospholipase|nr:lysophospholipase [Anaerolineae bacterium]MDH7475054.1 alpha/beta hydrolase [Anaerolineae bacterium]